VKNNSNDIIAYLDLEFFLAMRFISIYMLCIISALIMLEYTKYIGKEIVKKLNIIKPIIYVAQQLSNVVLRRSSMMKSSATNKTRIYAAQEAGEYSMSVSMFIFEIMLNIACSKKEVGYSR